MNVRKKNLIESSIKKIVLKIVAESSRKKRKKYISESIDFKSPEIVSKIKKAANKLDSEIRGSSEPILLVDSNRGIYMYKFFADEYADIKLDSNDEYYIEDYETLESKINSAMKNGYVIVDEDLWLYPNDCEREDY